MLRQTSDLRQIGTVAIYLALVGLMFLSPAARHPLTLIAACAFGWFTMLVNHNVMHLALFESKHANQLFRIALSFCALFPVSSTIPSHNLIHHVFNDDGNADWAAPEQVRFRWNLLNLLHFPNVVGPVTFNGVNRWCKVRGRAQFRRQYLIESVCAFGLTGLLLACDFWTTLFYVMVPQLFSARSFLRINLLQHDGADTSSEWNHSRNFVGKAMNWFWLNGGFHTIHHNRPTLHWSTLPQAHETTCAAKLHPTLVEKSFTWYLARTYLLRFSRPQPMPVAHAEHAGARAVKKMERATTKAAV